MGFRSRERKRKKRVAMEASRNLARRSGSAGGKWWLTIVTIKTCCAVCGRVLPVNAEMMYRARPREARCRLCGESLPYRPSTRWETNRREDRKRGR